MALPHHLSWAPSLQPLSRPSSVLSALCLLTTLATQPPAIPAYNAPPSLRSIRNHPIRSQDRLLHHPQRPALLPDFIANPGNSSPDETESGSSPTDHRFASGCSPPRLATDAVTFSYEAVADLDGDFHPASGAPSRAHIGVGTARAAPPSEPYGRFSRIRLSSQVSPRWERRITSQASASENSPRSRKWLLRQRVWAFLPLAPPPSPLRFANMRRRR